MYMDIVCSIEFNVDLGSVIDSVNRYGYGSRSQPSILITYGVGKGIGCDFPCKKIIKLAIRHILIRWFAGIA